MSSDVFIWQFLRWSWPFEVSGQCPVLSMCFWCDAVSHMSCIMRFSVLYVVRSALRLCFCLHIMFFCCCVTFCVACARCFGFRPHVLVLCVNCVVWLLLVLRVRCLLVHVWRVWSDARLHVSNACLLQYFAQILGSAHSLLRTMVHILSAAAVAACWMFSQTETTRRAFLL